MKNRTKTIIAFVMCLALILPFIPRGAATNNVAANELGADADSSLALDNSTQDEPALTIPLNIESTDMPINPQPGVLETNVTDEGFVPEEVFLENITNTTPEYELDAPDEPAVTSSIASMTQASNELLVNAPIDIDLPAGQSAVYRFAPSKGGVYNIFTGPFNNTGPTNDTILELYADAALTEIIDVNDDYNGTVFSRITQQFSGGVEYYVKTYNYHDSIRFRARLAAEDSGLKTLPPTPTFTPTPTHTPTPTLSVSPAIKLLSLNQLEDIDEPAGNIAVYKFTPETSGEYVFYSSPFNGNGGNCDTILTLYSDANLAHVLAENDDWEGSVFSRVATQLSGGASYYIKLRNYHDNVRLRARLTSAITFRQAFPDNRFRQYVLCIYLFKDKDDSSAFTEEDQLIASSIPGVELRNEGISDLTGIEYFTGLTYLNCLGNNLTALDVSKNVALTYLNCSNNRLTSLNVAQSAALMRLECDQNFLTGLDVSNNAAMTYLNCRMNSMGSEDSVIGWQSIGLKIDNSFWWSPQRS